MDWLLRLIAWVLPTPSVEKAVKAFTKVLDRLMVVEQQQAAKHASLQDSITSLQQRAEMAAKEGAEAKRLRERIGALLD